MLFDSFTPLSELGLFTHIRPNIKKTWWRVTVPRSSSSPAKIKTSDLNPRFICFLFNSSNQAPSLLTNRNAGFYSRLSPKSAASSSSGCREKIFAIIGVKVYAAGLYTHQSIFSKLDAWKGQSSAELQQDSSVFDAIFQAPLEKSLHIILVRDIDGKTFWDALDEAISPRVKSPTPDDESALSTFQNFFQGRPLKKGTAIFLTWLNPTKVLVCVSPEGTPPAIDATIESSNVSSALFDVFLGSNSVSPSLKVSTSSGLAAALK